jgi:hypothetical protein
MNDEGSGRNFADSGCGRASADGKAAIRRSGRECGRISGGTAVVDGETLESLHLTDERICGRDNAEEISSDVGKCGAYRIAGSGGRASLSVTGNRGMAPGRAVRASDGKWRRRRRRRRWLTGFTHQDGVESMSAEIENRAVRLRRKRQSRVREAKDLKVVVMAAQLRVNFLTSIRLWFEGNPPLLSFSHKRSAVRFNIESKPCQ